MAREELGVAAHEVPVQKRQKVSHHANGISGLERLGFDQTSVHIHKARGIIDFLSHGLGYLPVWALTGWSP